MPDTSAVSSHILVHTGFMLQRELRTGGFSSPVAALHTLGAYQLQILWIKPVLVQAASGFDLVLSRSESYTHFNTIEPSLSWLQFHKFTLKSHI